MTDRLFTRLYPSWRLHQTSSWLQSVFSDPPVKRTETLPFLDNSHRNRGRKKTTPSVNHSSPNCSSLFSRPCDDIYSLAKRDRRNFFPTTQIFSHIPFPPPFVAVSSSIYEIGRIFDDSDRRHFSHKENGVRGKGIDHYFQ